MPTVLVTAPTQATLMQNSPFSSPVVAVTIASTHFANTTKGWPGWVGLVKYGDGTPKNGHPSQPL